MTLRIGEVVFTRAGDPGIIKGRDTATGQLELDVELPTVKQDMRHGYINGFSRETREAFNKILDEVKESTSDPHERTSKFNEKLAELEGDPKQLQLAQYVKAEMLHFMNMHNIKPKIYSVHETKTR